MNTSHSLYAKDIDGDGDNDVVVSEGNEARVRWFENDGKSPPSWTTRNIDLNNLLPQRLGVVDIDGDSDMDVIVATKTGNSYGKISYYENDGASPPGWTRHIVYATVDESSKQMAYATDIDGDGDVDILATDIGAAVFVWLELTDPANTNHVWDNGGAGSNCSTAGNWESGTIPGTGSYVMFDGTSSTVATWDSGCPAQIRGLILSASGGYQSTVTIDSNLQVGGEIWVQSGTLVVNAKLTGSGVVEIFSGGVIQIGSAGELAVGDSNSRFTVGGTLTNNGIVTLGGQGEHNMSMSFHKRFLHSDITNNKGSTWKLVGVETGSTILIPDLTYDSLTLDPIDSTYSANVPFWQKAAMDINGDLTITEGTLSGSLAITLSGNWLKETGANYLAGGSTVTLDGGDQTMSGSNTFFNLVKTVTSAQTFTLAATAQQIISSALTLRGISGNLMSLRSSITDLAAKMQLTTGGTQPIDFLNVQDNDASGGEELDCDTGGEECVNSGNNTNWNFGAGPGPTANNDYGIIFGDF